MLQVNGINSNITDERFHPQLYEHGVAVAVAAGNDNDDASNHSPARVEQAITVAASNIDDERTYFSNFGAPVNVFAAGLNVISTWNDGGTNMISGTSMATPHVAGFAAYLLGLDSSLTPAQIAAIIDEKSLKNVLSNVREFFVPCRMFDPCMLKVNTACS